MTNLADVDTLAGLVRARAEELGDRTAIQYGETTLTYADLDTRASRAASALRASGLGPGDRVAFLDRNGLEFLDVLFGAAKLGAVLVPLNWRLAPAEMAHIINDAGALVFVAHADFAEHLGALEPMLETVLQIVVIGGDGGHQSFDAWIAAVPDATPENATGPGDVALQLYTSGTTGLPKGVMLTNSNILALLRSLGLVFGIERDSVQLAAMPLYHIGGGGAVLGGLYRGCTTILHREVELAAILRAIGEHGVTNTFLVPAVIQSLLRHPDCRAADVASLRTIAYGASPIPEDVLVEALDVFGCGFIQSYGLTETAGPMTILTADEHIAEGGDRARLRSCGRPVPGSAVRVVDPETGEDRPAGAPGEVWIRSPQNMLGYWRNPEATAATLLPGNWLRSGDIGYLDGDGYLYLYDRLKDMILTGGENVYPAEVENALFSHPAVADAAVIGVPDARWGEAVMAFVVRAPGSAAAQNEIIAHVRERIAHYKAPKQVEFVDELPRNPSGKLLRRDLREPYWRGEARRIH
jgi:long-chain acyl-CoA synthetase